MAGMFEINRSLRSGCIVAMDSLRSENSGSIVGKRDKQTVVAGGGRAALPKIAGVEIIELGNVLMVIVPIGVWHGLRNESGQPAGYLNIVAEAYSYADPDNWRLAPGTPGVPDIL